MSEKLKSRKLWAFIAVVILVVLNFAFNLGMPPNDVLYLVILAASYILGQGYVDAKQQPTQQFPVPDFTNSVISILQSELAKIDFSKNFPMEQIIELIKSVMQQEVQKIFAPPTVVNTTTVIQQPSPDAPPIDTQTPQPDVGTVTQAP